MANLGYKGEMEYLMQSIYNSGKIDDKITNIKETFGRHVIPESYGISAAKDDNTEGFIKMSSDIRDGDTIYLSEIYKIKNGTLSIHDVNNIKITGKGGLVSENNYSTIFLNNCKNVVIEGVSIETIYEDVWSDAFIDKDGSEKQRMNTTGIMALKCENVVVQNIKMKNIPGVGIVNNQGKNFYVINNLFEEMGGNVFNTADKEEIGFYFSGNTVKGCYDSFIGTHNAFDIVISDNILHKNGTQSNKIGNTGYGIDIPGGNYVTVTGNIIKSNIQLDEDLSSGYGIHIHNYGIPCKHVVVSNNIISKCNVGISVAENATDITLNNNSIIDSITGIKLKDCSEVIINQNTVKGCKIGIDAWSATTHDNIIIKDNEVIHCIDLGLTWGPNSTNCSIYNNIFNGADSSISYESKIDIYDNTFNNKIQKTIMVNTLKDLLRLNHKGPVLVRKYHEDMDYEPKLYLFNKSLHKKYHNGGNIIDPLKEFPSDWNINEDWFNNKNSGNGVWVNHEENQLDAKWFGAKGDGIYDDYLPLQTAIFSLTGWNGNDYKTDYINPKTLFIPRGKYRITDSLKVAQMNNIKGEGYNSGDSRGTEIVCDFDDYTPPTNHYSNIAEGHPNTILDKKPMLYNVKMFNYGSISNIRFNGNNKDVYGIYLSDMYYSKLDSIHIDNCLNSGLTLIHAQFNQVNDISYIANHGPIRIINSATLNFTNLDIENSRSKGTDLEIVHSSKWKGGINIKNIHIEELNSGSEIAPGAVWLIGQKGVHIEGLFGLFSTDTDSGSLERYIHYSDPQDYYFDGCTITSTEVHDCVLESVGSGHMFVKFDKDVRNTRITGMKVVQPENANHDHQTNFTDFQTGFKIKTQDGYKIMWFEEDKIHFFDNSNRRMLTNGADMVIQDTHGRLVLKAGSSAGNSEIQSNASLFTILDKEGHHGNFEKGLLRLSGHYLWVDENGKLRIHNSYPTADTDGIEVGS